MTLDALYAQLPTLQCKGLCWRACTRIGCSDLERERIEKAAGKPLTQEQDGSCSMLEGHRCTVYDVRPMICRLWGIDEAMPCQYGCEPEPGAIPEIEAVRFLHAALAIGGGDYNDFAA